MKLCVLGDSIAGRVGAHLVGGAKRLGTPARLSYRVSSRIEDWNAIVGQELDREPATDCVLFLGTNHYADGALPSAGPIFEACRRRAVRLTWVGPTSVRGNVPAAAIAALKLQCQGRGVDYLDSASASPPFELGPDQVHPTDRGAKAWALWVWTEIAPAVATAVATGELSDAFFDELVALSGRLGVDPEELLLVMNAESGISPARVGGAGAHYVGLIQFGDGGAPGVPATYKNLGFTGTRDEFRALSAEAQLPYVEKYLAPYAPLHLSSAARLWQAVLLPASLREPEDEPVMARLGTRWRGEEARAYEANRWLDAQKKGAITAEDLTSALIRSAKNAGPRLHDAVMRVRALTGDGPRAAALAPIGSARASELGAWAAVGALVTATASLVYLTSQGHRIVRRVAA
jgi:hypothetical protein